MRLRLLLLLLFSASSVLADSFLYAASPYNAFVLGNFTGVNSDVEGGLAAGGTVNLSSYAVGLQLTPAQVAGDFGGGDDTLVGGTNLLASNGSLYHGNAFEGGPANGIQPSFNLSGGSEQTGSGPIDFSAAKSDLDSFSTLLAAAGGNPTYTSGNSCVEQYGNTTCTATHPGINIINVTDPSMLATNITINSTYQDATLVLNVAGTSANLGGGGFSAFNNGKTVLFNYYQATNLHLGYSGFTMSLLAPFAAVTGGGDNFNGNFIAFSYNGSTQFNSSDMFTGNLDTPVAAPEPGTVLIAAAGLIAVAGLRRRISAPRSASPAGDRRESVR